MEDTLISFKTAKLAKEKGFNKKVLFSYEYSDKKSFLYCGGVLYNSSKNKYGYTENLEYNLYNHNSHKKLKVYSAPSQSKLQAWLREKHNIEVYIIPWVYNNKTVYDFFVNYEGESMAYSTYELALETSLIEGLKHIK
jgi:hypothetical protein